MKITYLTILPLALLILATGCKKEPMRVHRSTSNVVDKPYFFSANIDGKQERIQFDMDTEEYVISFSEQTSFDGDFTCVTPGTSLTRKLAQVEVPATSFKNFCFNKNEVSSVEHFYEMFSPDGIAYTTNPENDSTGTHNSGILISWIDAQGKVWSSQYGPQLGSFFKITGSQAIQGPNDEIQLEVHAEFECILYDTEGNTKKLTEGKYWLPYEKLFD